MQSICNQSMFISCTLHYLKNINLVDYHLRILTLIRNSLPSAGNALKPLSTFVSEQLCRNLLQITNGGSTNSSSSSGANYLVPTIAYMSAISSSINIPDLIISILKQLSYILHYCLLNSSFSYSNMNLLYSNEFSTSPSLFGQFMPSSSGKLLNYYGFNFLNTSILFFLNLILVSTSKYPKNKLIFPLFHFVSLFLNF